MVWIQSKRCGPIWLAVTVDHTYDVTMTWGFTDHGASMRLLRKLDKIHGKDAVIFTPKPSED